MLELIDIGLTMRQAQRASRLWGFDALQTVKRNPYGLHYTLNIPFAAVDRIALDLGIEPKSPMRIEAFGVKWIRQETLIEGHCYIRDAILYIRVARDTRVQREFVAEVIADSVLFVVRNKYVLETRVDRAEAIVADVIKDLHMRSYYDQRQ